MTSAATALVSPLAFEAPDQWRSEANRRLRHLLGADCATFMLKGAGPAYLYSDEWPPEIPNSYPDRVAALDRSHHFWDRQLAAGVWSRRQVFSSAMYRSSYYTDFVVPSRAFDAIGITIMLRDGLAGLLFHHTDKRGRRFGQRGLALLRLLRPAFVAGVRCFTATHAVRAGLATVCDSASVPMLLVDRHGGILHVNPAAGPLVGAIGRHELTTLLARGCAEADAAARGRAGPVGARRRVRIGDLDHDLVITHAGPDLESLNAVAVVTIHPASSEPLSRQHAGDASGLTPTERKVAQLLAYRRSNREIAVALGISAHTARHHTERVLAKLGVRSRNDVSTRLCPAS